MRRFGELLMATGGLLFLWAGAWLLASFLYGGREELVTAYGGRAAMESFVFGGRLIAEGKTPIFFIAGLFSVLTGNFLAEGSRKWQRYQ